jgi:hypothetical protein
VIGYHMASTAQSLFDLHGLLQHVTMRHPSFAEALLTDPIMWVIEQRNTMDADETVTMNYFVAEIKRIGSKANETLKSTILIIIIFIFFHRCFFASNQS